MNTENTTAFTAVLSIERARLVRLCAYLTGSANAAEDLAQETLYEAWRNARKLHDPADPTGRSQWLSAIARNICLRWSRSRRRELRYRAVAQTPVDPDQEGAAPERVDGPAGSADVFDLALDLERHELVHLLNRALGLLPPATRQALIECYVEESPRTQTALRLGLSEGAVAMKLQRGKRALRHLLATKFRHEALSFGLIDGAAEEWQETRIWCPLCGQRRLIGRFVPDRSELSLRCPACCAAPGVYVSHGDYPALFNGITRVKPALNRVLAWYDDHFQRRPPGAVLPCLRCGQLLPIRGPLAVSPHVPPMLRATLAISVHCDACGANAEHQIAGRALALPEGRQFWRDHPRIHLLPPREIDLGGVAAVVTRFESVTTSATLDVVSVRDTFEVVQVQGQ
ncbi:MAG TPA: RNA polymerase sigma factor, partial [Chloroflexota bacterium]|nr:RNA polymerase sigma factor [Chloroflexota bacterium]